MALCIGKDGLDALFPILLPSCTKNTDILYIKQTEDNSDWPGNWEPEEWHGRVFPGFSFCFMYYARLSARVAGNSEMPTGIDKEIPNKSLILLPEVPEKGHPSKKRTFWK